MELKIVAAGVAAGAILVYKKYGSTISKGSIPVSVSGLRNLWLKIWGLLSKIFGWFTFRGIVKILTIALLVYMFWGLGNDRAYFWQPRQYVSRFKVIPVSGILVYEIPRIPDGYKNEIILNYPIGFIFPTKRKAEILFPGAELIRAREGKGDALGRRFGNAVFGLDNEPPMLVFKNTMPLSSLGAENRVAQLLKGDVLKFEKRAPHKIYIQGGSPGDIWHIYFHLQKF